MADSHLISGLVEKRAELAGEMAKLLRQVEETRADIASVDRTLKLCGYTGNVTAIAPVERRTDGTKPGEIQAYVLDILRESPEPVRSGDIARQLMRFRGQDAADKEAHEVTKHAVRGALCRLAARHLVEQVGAGMHTAWRLID